MSITVQKVYLAVPADWVAGLPFCEVNPSGCCDSGSGSWPWLQSSGTVYSGSGSGGTPSIYPCSGSGAYDLVDGSTCGALTLGAARPPERIRLSLVGVFASFAADPSNPADQPEADCGPCSRLNGEWELIHRSGCYWSTSEQVDFTACGGSAQPAWQIYYAEGSWWLLSASGAMWYATPAGFDATDGFYPSILDVGRFCYVGIQVPPLVQALCPNVRDVSVACCPGVFLPRVMYLTFGTASGCASCLSGVTIPLVWDDVNDWWSTGLTALGTCTDPGELRLFCSGGTTLLLEYLPSGSSVGTLNPFGLVCDPFYVYYNAIFQCAWLGEPGANDSFTITVTE